MDLTDFSELCSRVFFCSACLPFIGEGEAARDNVQIPDQVRCANGLQDVLVAQVLEECPRHAAFELGGRTDSQRPVPDERHTVRLQRRFIGAFCVSKSVKNLK